MQNDVPVRVLIFGSCVSRDILDYQAAENRSLKLVDYFARSSMASLAAIPFEIPLPACLNNIKSAFQLRMVQRDMRKTFFEDLKTAEFDILLLDFIDERFNLWLDSLGTACTLSSELVQTGFLTQHSTGREIASGSDEFWSLWETGWSIFVKNLVALGLIERLRINKVFWSSSTKQGQEFGGFYSQSRIVTANKLLERMYHRIESDIQKWQLLTFEQKHLQAADAHKWGISPFHYCDEYYAEAIRQLCRQGISATEKEITAADLSNKNCNATAAYDLSAWDLPVHQYNSIDSLIYADFNSDGIYQIELTENWTLDLCAQGMHLLKKQERNRVILVGLSGAVANRMGKKAPFFSGLSIAKSLDLPIISVADPTLAMDPDLPLAWYAGSEAFPNLQKQLAHVLDGLSNTHQARLLIFGGSGGGFAALNLATLLECRASILVWNPQTSISDYVPQFVDQFLKVAFPTHHRMMSKMDSEPKGIQSRLLRDALESTGITHSMRGAQLQAGIDLIYLQNQGDWHLTKHAKPYIDQLPPHHKLSTSTTVSSGQIAVFYGQWGEGHSAPSKEMLQNVLRMLAEGDSPVQIVRALENGLALPSESTQLQLQVIAKCENGKIYASCRTDNEHQGIKFAFYLLVDGSRCAVRWYETTTEAYFDFPSKSGRLEVIGFARDGLGGQVSSRTFVNP